MNLLFVFVAGGIGSVARYLMMTAIGRVMGTNFPWHTLGVNLLGALLIGAVTELFGPEHATLSAKDWLDESEQIDKPHRATSSDWRGVTVAASARLPNRRTLVRDHRTLAASTDTKATPIMSANNFASVLGV